MLLMYFRHIVEVFQLIISDNVTRYFTLFVTSITFLSAVISSSLAALVIYTYYLLGFVFCWFFIRYQKTVSKYIRRLVLFYRDRISGRKKISHSSCNICNDLTCKRHQQNHNFPWRNLNITEDLNTSIENFYNKIIENFISTWYGQFTDDVEFINELKYGLRFSTATLIARFLEIDTTKVIANKLIPCVVQHIESYIYVKQFAKLRNARFNDVLMEYLGKRLHAATTCRKNELSYLRYLASSLLIHLLPTHYVKCRNFSVLIREIVSGWVLLPLMDVLADPNIINSFTILVTNYKPKKVLKSNHQVKYVEFLNNFNGTTHHNKSSFSMKLETIKNNNDLLYGLMQFLKKQGQVQLLRFCLDVDEFNNKLLSPDLTKRQLSELHIEAKKIYEEYLNVESYNFIECPTDICNNFHNLIEDNIYNTSKLKTSEPLYEAYNHAFNLLESIWLSKFFHSSEFFSYICRSKFRDTSNKSNMYRRKTSDVNLSTVSKISCGLGKIKGVLRTAQPIEGALDNQLIEDCTVGDIYTSHNLYRDLNTWKVNITSCEPNISNKIIHFCINVERPSNESNQWFVLRKDQDFYTLKSKLVEFHGEYEISDSPLPTRKAGSSVEVRMAKYEDFLKGLLQKPTLRGSDLLYTFLTNKEDFTVLSSSTPINQDFGNIYQSVTYKLRKEKGQHLEMFMSTFLNSAGRFKQGKLGWMEIGDDQEYLPTREYQNVSTPKTYKNHVFNDNFGVNYNPPSDLFVTSHNPRSLTECILYLLKNIFKGPDFILKFYVAICRSAQELVDYVLQKFIKRQMKRALSQSNLTYLVKTLEVADVVFNYTQTLPTSDQLEERKIKAFTDLKSFTEIPILNKKYKSQIQDSFLLLLEILQNPHYNKQLVYRLLDIIVSELYPSVAK